ncbi:MAG: transposase [Flavobacteriales bacterium]|nr:transposase [Flavobacteriales bacterium]
MNLKKIHIGEIIKTKVEELEISMKRICNFFDVEEEEIQKMYSSASIDTQHLIKWSRLLEFNFFRIYSAHLIMHYRINNSKISNKDSKNTTLTFKKNIYTQEIKDFLLGLIREKKMTHNEIIKEYGIPKTTIHRWMKKYL